MRLRCVWVSVRFIIQLFFFISFFLSFSGALRYGTLDCQGMLDSLKDWYILPGPRMEPVYSHKVGPELTMSWQFGSLPSVKHGC